MFETTTEIEDLQRLLDASVSGAGDHLRSIVTPGERTLSAGQLVRVATGICTLALATTTARGEPRLSGVDGHFLHGAWVVGTDPGAVKARHLADRPAVSAAHLRGDDLGIFTHGTAHPLNPAGAPAHPRWPATLDHLQRCYGPEGFVWDEVVFYRIEPTWMVAYSPDPAGLAGSAASTAPPA